MTTWTAITATIIITNNIINSFTIIVRYFYNCLNHIAISCNLRCIRIISYACNISDSFHFNSPSHQILYLKLHLVLNY